MFLKLSLRSLIVWCVFSTAAFNSMGFREPEQAWVWSSNFNSNTTRHRNLIPTSTTSSPVTEADDPCNYKSVMPDFRKPGRRISEAKCLEYVWERENRANKRRNSLLCYYKGRMLPSLLLNGRAVKRGEIPHMGALGWRVINGTWIFRCGSALISSKYALTAAHCSKSRREFNLKSQFPEIVRLGHNYISDVAEKDFLKSVDANIVQIIVHPKYSPPKKYYDIALVELAEDITFTNILHPACLWSNLSTDSLGRSATVAGWGVMDTVSRIASAELQAGEVDIIDYELCDSLLRPSCNRHWCGVGAHQICAGKLEGGVDTCQGDSGGPLQVKMKLPGNALNSMHYVIGVTSFGIGCGRRNKPGVYTRVSSFIDWIESVVWPENELTFINI